MANLPMRNRTPGQEVIAEFLRVQERVPPRTALARFFGGSPLSADSSPWYVGAKGEITVGHELSQLPPGWAVFHAVPIGTRGSDIDHIVIGPGGIFTINTKHHPGKNIWVGRHVVMVNGSKVPYLRNAEHEAARVRKVIGDQMPAALRVQPLVAIVAPKQIIIRQKPDQVVVLNARALRRWLENLPTVLPASSVASIATLMDDPALWGRSIPSRSDLNQEFTRLDIQVQSARTRRRRWAWGILGFVILVLSGIPQVLMSLVLQLS